MYRPKLFAGIELDERTRAGCAALAARLEDRGLSARFEATEKLHITLAFLGFVDPEDVESVRAYLTEVAAHHSPFDLTLDKIGAFPHERRPRIIYVGARNQGHPFRHLTSELRNAYSVLGFALPDATVAHVTIARVKGGDAHLPLLDEIAPLHVHVRSIALFESVPDKTTTRYEIRARAPLRAPENPDVEVLSEV
ncbi:MAG: RNA 2',3'-cyclic phosphodiesterase [Vulcanimicrobiaceae bacterium]